MTQLEVTYTQV